MARKREGRKARAREATQQAPRESERSAAEHGHVPRVGLSVEQAAEALGVSRSYMYQLIAGGAIASARVGRRRLIARTTITAYLRAQERAEKEAHRGG